MRFPLLSHEKPREVLYASERTLASQASPGVTFTVRRISAASRLDLIGRLGALATQLEMLRSSELLTDRVQAEALRIQIDREYLYWGLSKVSGLRIDGAPADAESLFANGPEALVREIVQCIRKECELDADEKKKLTIAFWFSRQSEPGWKCAECRALGLAEDRNCGFLGLTPSSSAPPVWAGGDIVLHECPKPVIRGESIAYIEAYWLWRFQGRPVLADQSARCLDAFLLIERLHRQSASTQP